MDSLTKEQKDEYATAFAILALYDGGADITAEQITSLLEATGNKDVEAFYPIIFANFLGDKEKLSALIAAGGGGGGGGGGGAAAGGDDAAAAVEAPEEVEEEEAPAATDMFGADAGEGGDY